MIHEEFGKDISNWKNIIHGIPIRNNGLQFILFYFIYLFSFPFQLFYIFLFLER